MTPIWEDTACNLAERIDALVEAASSRALQKRLGMWLEAQPVLFAEALARLEEQGHSPEQHWRGKRILRLLQAREQESRRRSTPIAMDESFDCAHCGKPVPKHGRSARNHCPYCLRSLHVDIVPGDRANPCHGILHPIGVEKKRGVPRLIHRCERCGVESINQVLVDGDPPDDWALVSALSAGQAIK